MDELLKIVNENKNLYLHLKTFDEIKNYIDKCLDNKFCVLDTETYPTEHTPYKIAGVCVKTHHLKAAYIDLLDDEVYKFMKNQLTRLQHCDNIIMHFGKYDYKVFKDNYNINIAPTWCTFIAQKLLNENEESYNLKLLHNKYIKTSQIDSTIFEGLMKKYSVLDLDPHVLSFYGAHDAEMTYELYNFQKMYLNGEKTEKFNLSKVYNLFTQIEMPLVKIVADMELKGIAIDFNELNGLIEENKKELQKIEDEIDQLMQSYKELVIKYIEERTEKVEGKRGVKYVNNSKLEYPVNVKSTTQLPILLFDILKLKNPNKNGKRTVSADILEQINHPLTNLLLKKRKVDKKLSTYLLSFLESNRKGKQAYISPITNRVHCNFNQIEAGTGRFSSSTPNLQNIPPELRKIFKADEGNVLIAVDYSAQEPRLLAHITQDPKMIEAYKTNKDLYAVVASMIFNVPYEDCLEFDSSGNKNPEGKARRSKAKLITLAIMYGKGAWSLSKDLNITFDEAKDLFIKIYAEFPNLKDFVTGTHKQVKEVGYVQTLWGRKRKLPSAQLNEFDIEPKEFIQDSKYNKLVDKLKSVNKYKRDEYINQLKSKGIYITDNTGKIAQALRQSVNARIQGSAADMTKQAMVLIGNDEILNKLGFTLLLTVHDELIGMCPIQNLTECKNRFEKLMLKAGDILTVPVKCDTEIFTNWGGNPYNDNL